MVLLFFMHVKDVNPACYWFLLRECAFSFGLAGVLTGELLCHCSFLRGMEGVNVFVHICRWGEIEMEFFLLWPLILFRLIVFPLFLLTIYYTRSSTNNSSDRRNTIFSSATLAITRSFIVCRNTNMTEAVTRRVFRFSFLITTCVSCTIIRVCAQVCNLSETISAAILRVSSSSIITRLRESSLLMNRCIFSGGSKTCTVLVNVFVGLFFLTNFTRFKGARASTGLLVTVQAGRSRALTYLMFNFIRHSRVVTFETACSFRVCFFLSLVSFCVWWYGLFLCLYGPTVDRDLINVRSIRNIVYLTLETMITVGRLCIIIYGRGSYLFRTLTLRIFRVTNYVTFNCTTYRCSTMVENY